MQHDVEPDAESDDEEDVPEEEEEEGGEYFVEHCDIDVVSGQPGMLGHKGDQLNPGEKKCNGGKMTLDIQTTAVRNQKNPDKNEQSSFQPVLDGEDVPAKGDGHLECFPYDEAKQKDGQSRCQGGSTKPQDDSESSKQYSL